MMKRWRSRSRVVFEWDPFKSERHVLDQNLTFVVCTLLPRPQHIACGAVEDYPRTLEEFEGRFATE